MDQPAQFELSLPLPVFQQSEGIAHDLAGVIVTATGNLGIDECFEVLAEGEAARHMERIPGRFVLDNSNQAVAPQAGRSGA
jgi:hypothetical protein